MRRKITKISTSALVLALACAGALSLNVDDALAKVKVSKVSVSQPYSSQAFVAKGKKIKIAAKVTVKPNKKKNKKVTYKIKNKNIASVSSKGIVKGKKAGKTKLIVISKKNKKKKKVIKIIVTKNAVSKVKFKVKSAKLAPGRTIKLATAISPAKNTSKQLIWKSSNKKAATVTQNGIVKGIAEGKTTITATAADGSKKKASCSIVVGAGISTVSVLDENLIRIKLSSAKKLTIANFDIKNKIIKNGKYTDATKLAIQSVKTKDNITYDITTENNSRVSANSYMKVTIPALVIDKVKEIYVGNIAGFEDATYNKVSYVTGYAVGESYNNTFSLDNSNVSGKVMYSVTGLPKGLKAYISKDKNSVKIAGVFQSVENGTTATLTGVDELGKKFVRQYKFLVSDKNTIVVNTEPVVALTYRKDNKATKQVNEESGSRLYQSSDDIDIVEGGIYQYDIELEDFIHVTGGETGGVSLDYDYSAIKIFDNDNQRLPIGPGKYNIKVTATANSNASLKKTFTLTLNLVDGVTLKGKVKDASGAAAPYVEVYGGTKYDIYDRKYELVAKSKADGSYTARVIPGDYSIYLYSGYSNSVLDSVGNSIKTNTTKDFTIPYYRTFFTSTIPNAVAYEDTYVEFYDSYGDSYAPTIVSDATSPDYGKMYAYLKKGSYVTVPESADSIRNTVDAYKNVSSAIDETTQVRNYFLKTEDRITWNDATRFKLSGSFTIAGRTTIKLNATAYKDNYKW